jgi:hypothetical protein
MKKYHVDFEDGKFEIIYAEDKDRAFDNACDNFYDEHGIIMDLYQI